MKERSTPEPQQTEETRPTPKPWVRPVLKPLGTMRERILGQGKTGSNIDGDPTGTFKVGQG